MLFIYILWFSSLKRIIGMDKGSHWTIFQHQIPALYSKENTIGDYSDQRIIMSLTLVCMYIAIGLCFLLFVNYKFLKLFIASLNQKFTTDANRNNIKISNKNSAFNNINGQLTKCHDIWTIPGPLRLWGFGMYIYYNKVCMILDLFFAM